MLLPKIKDKLWELFLRGQARTCGGSPRPSWKRFEDREKCRDEMKAKKKWAGYLDLERLYFYTLCTQHCTFTVFGVFPSPLIPVVESCMFNRVIGVIENDAAQGTSLRGRLQGQE